MAGGEIRNSVAVCGNGDLRCSIPHMKALQFDKPLWLHRLGSIRVVQLSICLLAAASSRERIM